VGCLFAFTMSYLEFAAIYALGYMVYYYFTTTCASKDELKE